MAAGSVPPGVKPTPLPPSAPAPVTKGQYEVDLPAGGRMTLQDAEEVLYWETNAKRYISDYGLSKASDLIHVGAILSQGIAMYRAQIAMADPKKANQAVNQITKSSEAIQTLEKSLGIDRKTREAGGKHETADYITRLKRAAHEKGVRISDRTKAFEAFAMELTWKIRLLRNGDDEDRAYHNLSEASIVAWAEGELAKLADQEKKWAHEKGKVFVGKL